MFLMFRSTTAGRSIRRGPSTASTQVSQLASENDLLVIAKRRDGGMLVIVAENGSSAANQIEWLFGLSGDMLPGFSVRAELENDQDRIGFTATFILESIGVVVEPPEATWLDVMLSRFGGTFPKTLELSGFARETLPDVDPREDPDAALIGWMEREEILFRTLERYLIGERLSQGFGGMEADVDGFMSFSLSVQNRRKSRVGLAFENHLSHLFGSLGIRHSRAAVTERRSKPDFLFPGVAEYHDPAFDPVRLTMLGVKSTCKDRWRQILPEADRISPKHLMTLEAGISGNQMDEMRSQGVQLVLPRALHETYSTSQRGWLQDVRGFADLVAAQQR